MKGHLKYRESAENCQEERENVIEPQWSSVATPWSLLGCLDTHGDAVGSHRTLNGGAHFELTLNKCRPSAFKLDLTAGSP